MGVVLVNTCISLSKFLSWPAEETKYLPASSTVVEDDGEL